MRFLTDDAQFGLCITPSPGQGLFRFQVVIGGQLIGDNEPCILGSAMRQLKALSRLDDEIARDVRSDPVAAVRVLRSDERMHDATTLSLAESIDRWIINGFVQGGDAVFIAQEYAAPAEAIVVSVIDADEYNEMVHAACDYWSRASGRRNA